MSCGVGHRHRSDPKLLWLWCRPASIALIRALAWEPPYALGVALKRQRQKKKKKIRGAGRMNEERAVKLLCMILQWWMHVIIRVSKPTECVTPWVNPDVNYRLGVIMPRPWRFMDCYRCATRWGIRRVWEAVWGLRVYGNSLFFVQFASKTKTSQRNKVHGVPIMAQS